MRCVGEALGAVFAGGHPVTETNGGCPLGGARPPPRTFNLYFLRRPALAPSEPGAGQSPRATLEPAWSPTRYRQAKPVHNRNCLSHLAQKLGSFVRSCFYAASDAKTAS